MHASMNNIAMADSDQQLFNELIQRFPEVPRDVVTKLMRQNSYNRVRCIEALGIESNSYLYETKFTSHPDFRGRANSADSTCSIGSSSSVNIGINSGQTQPSAQFYNHGPHGYTRVENYSSYPQNPNASYQQSLPNRLMHIRISQNPHPQFNTSHANDGQVSQEYGGWVDDMYPTSTHNYPYQSPPQVQRYPEIRPSLPPNSRPARPMEFKDGFPQNSTKTSASPGTPTSQTSVYSNTGTPSTPPVVAISPFVKTLQSPEHPYGYSSHHVVIPREPPSVYDQSHAYAQYQVTQVPSNQNQTFKSHIIIPPSSNRTPSPSQPPPNSFYNSINVRPCRPPDSFPSFPLNQQKSSDSNSSPGTPHHQFPQVFTAGLQSPVNRQDHKGYRVAFNIPDPSLIEANTKHEDFQNTSYATPSVTVDNFNHAYMQNVPDNNNFSSYPVTSTTAANGQIFIDNRRRSGSIEESQYLQTLLEYQNQRREKLNEDLLDSYRLLKKTQSDVSSMESEMLTRRKSRTNYTAVTADDVHKIRQENRRLQIDIQLLTREIDLVNNGQTPLGILDTHQLQSFYINIDPGQTLHSNNNSRPSTPPRRPPPPRPPLEIQRPRPDIIQPPPDLPPRQAPQAGPEIVDEDSRRNWICSACTFLNHPDLDKCEMCEMPRLS